MPVTMVSAKDRAVLRSPLGRSKAERQFAQAASSAFLSPSLNPQDCQRSSKPAQKTPNQFSKSVSDAGKYVYAITKPSWTLDLFHIRGLAHLVLSRFVAT